MPWSFRLRLDLLFLFGITAVGHSGRHSTGASIGAPSSLIKTTNIFADFANATNYLIYKVKMSSWPVKFAERSGASELARRWV